MASFCEKCDGVMHPADAMQWLICPRCRYYNKIRNGEGTNYRATPPLRKESYGRPATSPSMCSSADGTRLGQDVE